MYCTPYFGVMNRFWKNLIVGLSTVCEEGGHAPNSLLLCMGEIKVVAFNKQRIKSPQFKFLELVSAMH